MTCLRRVFGARCVASKQWVPLTLTQINCVRHSVVTSAKSGKAKVHKWVATSRLTLNTKFIDAKILNPSKAFSFNHKWRECKYRWLEMRLQTSIGDLDDELNELTKAALKFHLCLYVWLSLRMGFIDNLQTLYSSAFRKGAMEPMSSQSGMALPLNLRQDSAQVCPWK